MQVAPGQPEPVSAPQDMRLLRQHQAALRHQVPPQPADLLRAAHQGTDQGKIRREGAGQAAEAVTGATVTAPAADTSLR